MIVTNEFVQTLTEQLSITFFNRPFLHKAYINKRLKTTGGRYLLSSHNIEVNEKYIIEYGKEELIGIIKHELCHYHLHLQGKGYKHGDADFKKLLSETNAPRYCKPLSRETTFKKARPALHYCCSQCGMVYKRHRRVNIKKYVCGACQGQLKELNL